MSSEVKMKERKDISQEIMALCAMKAVLSTEGVASMADTAATMSYQIILGSGKAIKGVKLQMGDKIQIDVALNVLPGVSIPQTAWMVQENVKNKLEALTDAPVERVDVYIAGVSFN